MKALWLVFFVLLPLQWVGVASTPLGELRLHQIALLGLAACIAARYRLRVYAPVLRTAAVFVVANVYMVVVIAVVSISAGGAVGGAAQLLLYLLAFVAIAGHVHQVAGGREQSALPVLGAAAAVVCLSLLVGLSVGMLVNGVNPVQVLARSVAAADPEIVQREVFRTSFAGFGLADDQVSGNLRHEIFGSVLLAMAMSTWAMRVGRRPSTAAVRLYRVAMVVGVVLLAASLSRSVLIAAAVWPLLSVLRSLRRNELTRRQVTLLLVSAAGVVVLLLSGLGTVIANRFLTDTTGYQTRAGNYAEALSALPEHWWTGGFDTRGASTHNLVLDTMLRSGFFAALPALVVLGVVALAFGLLVAHVHTLPPALVPVVAVLALPLVRMGTSGGGSIPPVEWLALAFVTGVLTQWRRSSAGGPAPASVTAGRREAPVRV